MSEQFVPEIRVAGFDSEWTKASLDSLVGRFYGGGTPSKSDERYWQGNIPWIQSSDLSVEEIAGVHPVKFVSDEAVKRSATQIIPPNSIAVVTRVGVGKVAVMDDVYATSQDFASLCDVNGDPHFLARTLQRRISLDLGFLQGSTIKGMTVAELKSKVISFPPPHEQRLIGGLFKALDDTISSHQQKHRQLQQAKASLMQRMFPAAGESEPEIRFEGFAGAWTQNALGDLGRAVAGFGFPNVEQGGRVGTPFYKVSDMNLPGNSRRMRAANNYVRPEQIVRLSWKAVTDLPAVIFAKVGAAVFLGRKRIADHPFLIDNNMMAFCIDCQLLDAAFAQTLFETVNLSSLVQVGALPSFNPPALESLSVWVPETLAEQQAVGAFFSKLDDLIEAESQYVSKLQQVKSALLQKMFI